MEEFLSDNCLLLEASLIKLKTTTFTLIYFFQLKLSFMDPQGKNRYLDSSQIAAAEIRKSELLAEKENLHRNLTTNYQIKVQLQKQLQHILIMQHQERIKLTQFR